MHVLVVLLHARFSVVCPIPFLLAAIFFSGHPYIGSTTVFPDKSLSLTLQMRRATLVAYELRTRTAEGHCSGQNV